MFVKLILLFAFFFVLTIAATMKICWEEIWRKDMKWKEKDMNVKQ